MSDLLNASHLEQEELEVEQGDKFQHEFTLTNAVDHIRRRGYWAGKLVAVDEQERALLAPHLAWIEGIRTWAQGERELPTKRIEYHDAWFAAYYRANPPAIGKTLKLPGGNLTERAQQPEIVYSDEAASLPMLTGYAPDLLRYHPPEINKAELKKQATFVDGKVYITTSDGERVEVPGITIQERPPKFEFKPA